MHLEALNLLLALKTLLPQNPHEFCITVNTDKETSQQVLEAGRGRDPLLCACARQVWLLSTLYNFELIIKHKAGTELILADALSRRSFSENIANKALDLTEHMNLKEVFPTLTLAILDFNL